MNKILKKIMVAYLRSLATPSRAYVSKRMRQHNTGGIGTIKLMKGLTR
jgi:hypothetical protein